MAEVDGGKDHGISRNPEVERPESWGWVACVNVQVAKNGRERVVAVVAVVERRAVSEVLKPSVNEGGLCRTTRHSGGW